MYTYMMLMSSYVFVVSTEIGDREKRLEVIKGMVDQLPEINRRILVMVIEHLHK